LLTSSNSNSNSTIEDRIDILMRSITDLKKKQEEGTESIRLMLLETIKQIKKRTAYIEVGYRS
jgi:hypothetical protein